MDVFTYGHLNDHKGEESPHHIVPMSFTITAKEAARDLMAVSRNVVVVRLHLITYPTHRSTEQRTRRSNHHQTVQRYD